MIKDEERKLVDELLTYSWGTYPSGIIEDSGSGYSRVTTFIYTLGRRFIRGREIFHLPLETRLGEEFFDPPGSESYPGRVLS